ncbi:hypothetical protein BC834DRAFT_193041 [Gloeopeniophorella convolvens]|nr:hypothetical protein BC834DRAFT_193041 [Gloeopeniophorella convolvens]
MPVTTLLSGSATLILKPPLISSFLALDDLYFLAGPLHRLCAPPDVSPHVRHLRSVVPVTAPQGTVLGRQGLFGSSAAHFSLHAGVQDHLRRHLLEQVVVHCWPGYVRSPGDQPDGARDVLLPGVAAQCGTHHSAGLKARVRRNIQGPGPYPTVVLPPAVPASFAHPTSSTASIIPSFTPRIPMLKDAAPVIRVRLIPLRPPLEFCRRAPLRCPQLARRPKSPRRSMASTHIPRGQYEPAMYLIEPGPLGSHAGGFTLIQLESY